MTVSELVEYLNKHHECDAVVTDNGEYEIRKIRGTVFDHMSDTNRFIHVALMRDGTAYLKLKEASIPVNMFGEFAEQHKRMREVCDVINECVLRS